MSQHARVLPAVRSPTHVQPAWPETGALSKEERHLRNVEARLLAARRDIDSLKLQLEACSVERVLEMESMLAEKNSELNRLHAETRDLKHIMHMQEREVEQIKARFNAQSFQAICREMQDLKDKTRELSRAKHELDRQLRQKHEQLCTVVQQLRKVTTTGRVAPDTALVLASTGSAVDS